VIGMVLTIGLLGLAMLLCWRSVSILEQARSRLELLDTTSLERRTSELTSATDELAQAVDLQG
jgi:hypothetical protein